MAYGEVSAWNRFERGGTDWRRTLQGRAQPLRESTHLI